MHRGSIRKAEWIAAVLLLLAAAVFRFALLGYAFMGYTCAFFALCAAFFALLRSREEKTKTARRVFAVLLCLLLLFFAVGEIPIVRASRGSEKTEADYAIVLGAGILGTEPTLSLRERLEAARDYLTRYPNAIAIVSGSQAEDEVVSEATVMRRWLIEQGIAPERILMEEQANSTEENLRYSLAIIRERGGDDSRVAVISSEYHLYRAEKLAEALGCEALGYPAHTSYPVLRLNYFIREGVATLALALFGD